MLHRSTGANAVTLVMSHEGTRGLVNHCPATMHMNVAEASAAKARPLPAPNALMVFVPLGNTTMVFAGVMLKISISSPGTAGGKVTEYAEPALVTDTFVFGIFGTVVPLACVPVELAAMVLTGDLWVTTAAPLASS